MMRAKELDEARSVGMSGVLAIDDNILIILTIEMELSELLNWVFRLRTDHDVHGCTFF